MTGIALLISVLMIFVAGLANPTQTALNSRARSCVGSPLIACVMNFIGGTLAIVLITLIERGSLALDFSTVSNLPWWGWAGGAMGVIGLTANILLFPKLGSAQTVLMPMIGQVGMSILIDSFGWFGASALPLSVWKIVGICVVFAGLFVYLKGKSSQDGQKVSLWWSFAGILSGSTFAIQPAMNAALAVAADSSTYASMISFLISDILLVFLVLSIPSARRNSGKIISGKYPWWVLFSGPLGAYYVFTLTKSTASIGVGFTTLIVVLGMLCMGLVIDKKGLLGAPRRHISLLQYLGLVTVFAGVIVINLLG